MVITANEARELSSKGKFFEVEKLLNDIYSMIEAHASRGKNSLTVNISKVMDKENAEEMIKKLLRENGFKVRSSTNFIDYGEYLVIEW